MSDKILIERVILTDVIHCLSLALNMYGEAQAKDPDMLERHISTLKYIDKVAKQCNELLDKQINNK